MSYVLFFQLYAFLLGNAVGVVEAVFVFLLLITFTKVIPFEKAKK